MVYLGGRGIPGRVPGYIHRGGIYTRLYPPGKLYPPGRHIYQAIPTREDINLGIYTT